MARSFHWSGAAAEYEQLYSRLIGRRSAQVVAAPARRRTRPAVAELRARPEPPSSRSHPIRQFGEVVYDQVRGRMRHRIRRASRSPFVGPANEAGAIADAPGRVQVEVVARDHQDLVAARVAAALQPADRLRAAACTRRSISHEITASQCRPLRRAVSMISETLRMVNDTTVCVAPQTRPARRENPARHPASASVRRWRRARSREHAKPMLAGEFVQHRAVHVVDVEARGRPGWSCAGARGVDTRW